MPVSVLTADFAVVINLSKRSESDRVGKNCSLNVHYAKDMKASRETI